jgi:primosomal protein N'
LQYPPFSRLVYFGIIGRSRKSVQAAAERYAEILRAKNVGEVLGPATYPVARVNNEWRYRIAVKSRVPKALRSAIRNEILPVSRAERDTRLAINVDP